MCIRDRGRQQPDRADHVPQEHEGQHQAHVCLELDRREDPGRHADGQADAGEQHRLAGGLERLVVGVLQRHTLTQVGLQTAVDVDAVVDTDTHAQGDHRQGSDLHADAHESHQRVTQHRGQHLSLIHI